MTRLMVNPPPHPDSTPLDAGGLHRQPVDHCLDRDSQRGGVGHECAPLLPAPDLPFEGPVPSISTKVDRPSTAARAQRV